MNTDKLVELYLKRAPSGLTREEVEKEIACMADNWSYEQIFFSINYLSLHYPDELEQDLSGAFIFNQKEIYKYYQLAKLKKEVKQAEEGAVEYDSSNNVQGTNKPQWFRKGIDFDLFK